ncbi:serine hydrolase domain-containing protein [Dyella nitratireducens]|uniref:Serine hydrolase n=1 Tax=Dyella nitratireducens TaxID=1849580 RepID=A0ABQ1GIW0_9GAMM|nr:serine hydrolase domain-containing protein [Dyella nitratireducens]GGA44414.1 serine hydrolase [Dyella nitratireducens]GLQ41746.1 serine hydrolase [Dyella nitratireducens]
MTRIAPRYATFRLIPIGFVLAACIGISSRPSVAADPESSLAQSDNGPMNSNDPVFARLDSFTSGLTRENKFSGVVLVARNGHVLFEKAYGKRDAKGNDPIKLDTRFNLASAGKMFTSVAVWQQIAAGWLSLDTHVGDVLKDYPNRSFADTVTVRELLSHTSGAGDDGLLGNENAANRARVHSVADMVALESSQPPAFPPGTNQVYSNFGFVVLGRMVEVVSGEDFQSYLRRHIFEPAGMAHTGFIDCASTDPDLARGYTTDDGKLVFNCETLPGFPAGGEASTAGDMYRFVQALQSGKLISPALFAQATQIYRMAFGLGFFATDYGPGHLERDFRWGHGGSAGGVCTDVRNYPHTGETVIVLSNVNPPVCFRVSEFLHKDYATTHQAH